MRLSEQRLPSGSERLRSVRGLVIEPRCRDAIDLADVPHQRTSVLTGSLTMWHRTIASQTRTSSRDRRSSFQCFRNSSFGQSPPCESERRCARSTCGVAWLGRLSWWPFRSKMIVSRRRLLGLDPRGRDYGLPEREIARDACSQFLRRARPAFMPCSVRAVDHLGRGEDCPHFRVEACHDRRGRLARRGP